MRIPKLLRRSWFKGETGNTLLIALIVAAIILPLIWASIYMASVQQRTVALSQDWNAAMPVIEAGVEEAMAHLNNNCRIRNAANWTNDGWVQTGDIFTQERRTFADGSYYDVKIITNSGGASEMTPQIVCVGSVQTRFGLRSFTNAFLDPSTPLFANIGATGSEVDRGTNTFIKRQVRLTASRWGWPDVGQLGDGTVQPSGDLKSFNSEGSSSMWGRYNPDMAEDKVVVASINGDIDLSQQVSVYGSIMTGPDGSHNNAGSVGDTNWVDGGYSGVQSNHYSNNFQYEMPQPELPEGASFWPTLSECNCWRTYTKRYLTNGAWITTTNYPFQTPPGGLVLTNHDDVFYSSEYYSTYPGPPIETVMMTNSVTGWLNVPTNAVVISTQWVNMAWRTNSALSVTTAAQSPAAGDYRTTTVGTPSGYSYLESPGVYVYLQSASYTPTCAEITVPAGCYYGSVTNIANNARRCNENAGADKWVSQYSYAHISKKVYQPPFGTNYTYYVPSMYLYQGLTYSYYGPQTNNLVTNAFYRYHAPGGDYQMDSLTMSSGLMLITGKNRIYIRNKFELKGNAQIIMAPDSSIEFYVGGDVALGGNGIANSDERAKDLLIYGLPTCTSVTLSGNTKLIAGILAPQADIAINGGGSGGLIIGALAGKSIKSNGDPVDFVQDTALSGHVNSYFYPTEWKEEAVGSTP